MSLLDTLLRPRHDTTPVFTDDEAGITHLTCCCDTDKAMCGFELDDLPWIEGEITNTCVVCADLMADRDTCPRCGCEDC